MREILFRGKREPGGEWAYGFYVACKPRLSDSNKWVIQPVDEYGAPTILVYVDPNTVGQYTGLCDKNGKRIFEGDILRTNNSNCEIWTVGYVRGAFSAEQTNANYKCALGIFMMTSQVEVIGNIHDEPELMKGMEHGKE